MPRFRYEATDDRGIPVHGTADADNESALSELLSTRKLKLISASELSLNALIAANHRTLPRLYQLRVGEQLREALLSGLPAHEALRSVAAEPLSHPMLDVAPWLQCSATVIFLAVLTCWSLSGALFGALIGTAVVAFIVVPVIWILLRDIYCVRPKRLLRMFADRMEAGEQLPTQLSSAMSSELKFVMQSRISDDAKARVAADLVPSLLGANLKTQQFVMATIGPLAMLMVMLGVIYTGLLFVVPQFTEIFEGFGVELPAITRMVISISRMIDGFGVTGWVLMIALGIGTLIMVAIGITMGPVAEGLSGVPVFGMAFRWVMQARVARILAAMLRNGCTYGESLRTATAGSDFSSVKSIGNTMAFELDSGSGQVLSSPQLSGLPISMMFVSDAGRPEDDRRMGMAKTFQSLSEMLDSAAHSQGRLFSIAVQFFTIGVAGITVGFIVLALFLPLIQLLNDLS